MWSAGQQVICVNDRFTGRSRGLGDFLPKQGCIYTILSVEWCPDDVAGVYGVGLKLMELNLPGDGIAFCAWRFESIVEKPDRSLICEQPVTERGLSSR